MARGAANFIFVSVFLSHPSISESHPFSSAVAEQIQTALWEVAVKNCGIIKMMCSIPCLCCFSSLKLFCSIQLSPGVLQLYQMWAPKPSNLALLLCSIPKLAYWVAEKGSSLNKASWSFWLIGFTCFFPRRCVLLWAEQGLRSRGGDRPCFGWSFWGAFYIFCILELKSSAPLYIAGTWCSPSCKLRCRRVNSVYRRNCDAVGKCFWQTAASNLQPWESNRGLFSCCTWGRRATRRESSPWASPGFPGSARSLPLANLRGCV